MMTNYFSRPPPALKLAKFITHVTKYRKKRILPGKKRYFLTFGLKFEVFEPWLLKKTFFIQRLKSLPTFALAHIKCSRLNDELLTEILVNYIIPI